MTSTKLKLWIHGPVDINCFNAEFIRVSRPLNRKMTCKYFSLSTSSFLNVNKGGRGNKYCYRPASIIEMMYVQGLAL